MTLRAIVTDIEGTTSSIAFVHEVLFPYARARLAEFVNTHAESLTATLAQVCSEAGQPDLDRNGCIRQLLAWHDADRKVTPLKTLQGMIWAEAYAGGKLESHIYDDAAYGLERWHAQGITLYVYSSGSIAAQKLLFKHTPHGDLTRVFSGYFDTSIGGKKEATSYRAIACEIDVPARDILFLSDVEAELAAAHDAGFNVVLLARDRLPETCAYPVVSSFEAILPSEIAA